VPLRTDLSASADVITDVVNDALAIPIIALTLRDPGTFEAMPNESAATADTGAAGPSADTSAAPGAAPGRPGREPIEGVFLVQEGRARFRPVEVGIAGDAYFQVLSGLAEGDTVVSGTYQTIRDLKDGDPVKITARDSARAEP
jgi:HlyD family secretion protein